MPPRAVLFDLDGTLVQTREASWALFQETDRAFGLGVATQQAYFALLEENLFAALKRLCPDERTGDAAGAHFLNLLRTDYFPPLVPGMADVVRLLAGSCSLAVISSNAIAVIRRILSAAGIAHCFSHVFGGDVEPDKRASVRRFLTDASYAIGRACRPDYREDARPALLTGEQIVLVTDTVGDVRHARECGIRALGVAWGMHPEARLLEAGAEMVALWPQEVVAHLLPGGFGVAAGACVVGPADMTRPHDAAPACRCDDACSCAAPAPEQHASAIRRARATAAGERAAAIATTGAIAGAHDIHRDARVAQSAASPSAASPDAALLAALSRLRRAAGGMSRHT